MFGLGKTSYDEGTCLRCNRVLLDEELESGVCELCILDGYDAERAEQDFDMVELGGMDFE